MRKTGVIEVNILKNCFGMWRNCDCKLGTECKKVFEIIMKIKEEK